MAGEQGFPAPLCACASGNLIKPTRQSELIARVGRQTQSLCLPSSPVQPSLWLPVALPVLVTAKWHHPDPLVVGWGGRMVPRMHVPEGAGIPSPGSVTSLPQPPLCQHLQRPNAQGKGGEHMTLESRKKGGGTRRYG